MKKIHAQEAPTLSREEAVGLLYKKLPYTGVNFSMSYNYDSNAFVVSINKADPADGNTEFDHFLKDNQIDSRNWIRNLVIQ